MKVAGEKSAAGETVEDEKSREEEEVDSRQLKVEGGKMEFDMHPSPAVFCKSIVL